MNFKLNYLFFYTNQSMLNLNVWKAVWIIEIRNANNVKCTSCKSSSWILQKILNHHISASFNKNLLEAFYEAYSETFSHKQTSVKDITSRTSKILPTNESIK